jgi:hypothetical protein
VTVKTTTRYRLTACSVPIDEPATDAFGDVPAGGPGLIPSHRRIAHRSPIPTPAADIHPAFGGPDVGKMRAV